MKKLWLSINKVIKKLLLIVVVWFTVASVLYLSVFQPKKQKIANHIFVCAYEHDSKNFDNKVYGIMLAMYRKDPSKYKLCQQEMTVQYNEYAHASFTLIDKTKNEWEWKHSSDSMASPIISRYRIYSKNSTPEIHPLWMQRGGGIAKMMSMFYGFFLGLAILSIIQKKIKSKVQTHSNQQKNKQPNSDN